MKMKWLGGLWSLVVAFAVSSVAEAALVGEYLLEEGTGGIAEDTSGFDRDGVLSGATTLPAWTQGIYQGSTWALAFDGGVSAHRVQLPGDSDFIRNVPGATLMAWVRYDGTTAPSAMNVIAVSRNQSNRARAFLQVSADGFWQASGRRDNEGSTSIVAATGPLANDPSVYFLAGVYDYVGDSIQLYLGDTAGNFNLIASTTDAGWEPGNSADVVNTDVALGSNPGGGTNSTWQGVIDGARIFNHAMAASEIEAIFRAEVVPEPSSLVIGLLCGLAAVPVVRRARRAA